MKFLKPVSKKNPFIGWIGSTVTATLIVANCTIGQAATSPTIGQQHVVSPNTATISQSVSSPTFANVNEIDSKDCTIVLSSYPANLFLSVLVPLGNAAIALDSTPPTLAQLHIISSPDKATIALSSTSPTLSTSGVTDISPNGGILDQIISSPTIGQICSILPENSTIDIGSGLVGIGINVYPETGTIGQFSTSPDLDVVVSFIPDNAIIEQSGSLPTIQQIHSIAPNNSIIAISSGVVNLVGAGDLVSENAVIVISSEYPSIGTTNTLSPNDAIIASSSYPANLFISVLVPLNNAVQDQTCSSPTLTITLVLNNCTITQSATSPSFSLWPSPIWRYYARTINYYQESKYIEYYDESFDINYTFISRPPRILS